MRCLRGEHGVAGWTVRAFMGGIPQSAAAYEAQATAVGGVALTKVPIDSPVTTR